MGHFIEQRRREVSVLIGALIILVLLNGGTLAQDAEEAPAPEPLTTGDPGIDNEILVLKLLPLTAENLSVEASSWLELLKKENQAIADAQIELFDANEEQAETIRERIAELTSERDAVGRNFLETVAALEKKGGNPDEVAAYRQYYAAIFTEEIRITDFQTLVAKALAWLTDEDGGIRWGIRIAVIIASFLALLVVARIVRGLAGRAFRRIPDISVLLQAFLVGVIYWVTIAFGLMVVLSFLGINITPLFALFGGAAFILAFALQDTLANLASGIMIMINRPFDVGDYVSSAGIGGTVKNVSIASTTFVTPDNQIHVVPNSMVWTNIITNVTSSETRRIDLFFGIGYDDNIEQAQQVLEQVVAAHPLVLNEPAPVIRVSELAESSVNFICRPWSKTEDYWTVYWDLTQQVKIAFDRAGISIPFPQRDVHIHQLPPKTEAAPNAAAPAGTASPGTSTPAPADLEVSNDDKGQE